MRTIATIFTIAAYPFVLQQLINLHFQFFGGYEMASGKFAVDWLGILYIASSSVLLSALAFVLITKVCKQTSKLYFIALALFTCAVFIIQPAFNYGFGNAITYINSRPLHIGVVQTVLLAIPICIFVIGQHAFNRVARGI